MMRGSGSGETGSNPCSPEIRAIIGQMDAIMSRDPRYNHAGVPTQVAMDLIKAGLVTSFSEFEGWLREMGSKVHLVGVPLDFYGKEWVDKTINPFGASEALPEYTLWTGVNGDEEAAAMLTHLGITAEENRQRLLTTGVLSVS